MKLSFVVQKSTRSRGGEKIDWEFDRVEYNYISCVLPGDGCVLYYFISNCPRAPSYMSTRIVTGDVGTNDDIAQWPGPRHAKIRNCANENVIFGCAFSFFTGKRENIRMTGKIRWENSIVEIEGPRHDQVINFPEIKFNPKKLRSKTFILNFKTIFFTFSNRFERDGPWKLFLKS